MKNILINQEIEGLNLVVSNGNPTIAYDDKVCIIDPNMILVEYREQFGYTQEETIAFLKNQGTTLPFVKKINSPECSISLYFSQDGYVMLAFYKDTEKPFVVSYSIPNRKYEKKDIEKILSNPDQAYLDVCHSRLEDINTRLTSFFRHIESMKNKPKLTEKEITLEYSARAEQTVSIVCFHCGGEFIAEYSTSKESEETCPHCGAIIGIEAEATTIVDVTLKLLSPSPRYKGE